GAWLGEHADDLRERLNLGSPMPDVEIRDNESAIVAISVPLADELILVPDDDGIIPLRGLRYSLAGAQIRPAETFGIAA
ncbi:phage tail protein, partial [Klebsiella pneumoniae]|uniref:phage tail protein n=2 Tax=Klebsiella/Raoultella group TaxID=2890311 RepID=UPI0034D2C59B